MKKLILILVVLASTGCTPRSTIKPYIIVDAIIFRNINKTTYTYQDGNNVNHSFDGNIDQYQIGDTIK